MYIEYNFYLHGDILKRWNQCSKFQLIFVFLNISFQYWIEQKFKLKTVHNLFYQSVVKKNFQIKLFQKLKKLKQLKRFISFPKRNFNKKIIYWVIYYVLHYVNKFSLKSKFFKLVNFLKKKNVRIFSNKLLYIKF